MQKIFHFDPARRILQQELMDDSSLPAVDLESALKGLHRLNTLSFSSFFTAREIFRLIQKHPSSPSTPVRIMDLGSGGGEILIQIITFLRNRGISAVEGIGVDINPYSVERGNQIAKQKKIPIQFVTADAIQAVTNFEYDILTSSLFLHHLSHEDVHSIFNSQKASLGIVMSDLERTFAGYLLAGIASRLFSRSPVVHADAPQSVQAAFTKTEMQAITQKYLPGVKIRRIFPHRLLISWESPA